MNIPTLRESKLRAAWVFALLVPGIAFAHPGHGPGESLAAGLAHPLTGLDHVLLIVAISAWAARMRPSNRMLVAGCLALFVTIGATLPLVPASSRWLETSIALTVIGAGLLLALGRRMPGWAGAAMAAAFALVHGTAHGLEGTGVMHAYVPGLAVATAGLSVASSFAAARIEAAGGRRWLRAAGWLSAVSGAAMLA
jgi:urease accessory protein